ncbi:MAG: dephospho-CoA kinase [Oscillospiraceae bacterium]|jgi:dephospho-CoA kinase|nr:dephospho-CoA kinase [Oscillospiraceae bacterium]
MTARRAGGAGTGATLIFGITGGTGAGKTSALRALGGLGALTIDCDEVYHELLAGDAALRREIAERFPGAAAPDGIDRRALGRIVFGDAGALEDLNGITHKYVDAEVRRRLERWSADGGRLAAIDAIALIESGLHEICDVVVGVLAPARLREARITARDGISAPVARTRIAAQRSDTFFRRNCDHILINDGGDPAEFEKKCAKFFEGVIADLSR